MHLGIPCRIFEDFSSKGCVTLAQTLVISCLADVGGRGKIVSVSVCFCVPVLTLQTSAVTLFYRFFHAGNAELLLHPLELR